MIRQKKKSRNTIRRIVLSLLCFIILTFFTVSGQSVAAPVNGIVRQVGTQQILNVWGTNYEMGYAHGYLLADKIRDLIDYYMIRTVAGSVAAYNALLARDASEFQWQPTHLEEIRGIADGMVASGKNLYVTSLARNIDMRDIRAWNLQEEFYFGCSSFGVWGTATANSETVLARNLDFYWDTQGTNANYQMILAYEPTGLNKFISFAWPGYVGVYSGMNEHGITALANTGNIVNPYSGPFQPVSEVYRSILETATTANFFTQPLVTVTAVHENPSEIIQIGSSYTGSGFPVYYIEQSPDLDLIRYPAVSNYEHIIATNHFLSIPATPTSESLNRYTTIQSRLISLYGSGDKKVDSTEAMSILHSVANSVAPTLTSIVIRPNRMEFDLSFAKVENGVFTAATDIAPQTYTWVSLFPDHTIVAASDAYSVTANSTLNQPAPGVLANDSGSAGTILTTRLAGAPTHGTLSLNADGSFVYTPYANYVGSDSFTYQASDGTLISNTATVTIIVVSATTTLLADDFSRTSLSPWIRQSGTWTINNNVLQGTGLRSSYSYAYTVTDPLWSNYSAEAQVQLPAGAFGGGLGGRLNPSTGAHYGAWIYPAGSMGGSNVLKLIKFRGWTSWSGTPMQQVSLPTVGTGWHTLKMDFSGNRIQVYYDGTLKIDVTDNNFDSRAAYTSGGISADMWLYTTVYNMGFDNAVVKSLAANQPAVSLSSLSLNPASVKGGVTSQGAVTLTVPAPVGGVVVSLNDNSSSASVPATVTVASGSTSAVFTITTYPVTRSRTVTISAGLEGVTKTATLVVTR